MQAPRPDNGPPELEGGRAESRAHGLAGRPGAPALWIGAAVAAVIGTLLVIAGMRAFGPRIPEPQVRRFLIPTPQPTFSKDHPARISPDGRFLLFASENHLAIRDLERFESMDLAGTEGAFSYFWAQDGRRVCYFRDSNLWISDLAGATPVLVCSLPGGRGVHGGAMGPDDQIVFAADLGDLYVVPAKGGAPRVLLRRGPTDANFHDPEFLPDGRHILLVAQRWKGPNELVVVSCPEGVRKNLGEFEGLSAARHASSGHLLLTYASRGGEVQAVPFSAPRLEITGPPLLTIPGALNPSVSRDGTLAYHLGTPGEPADGILIVQNWAEELKRPAAKQ